MEIQWYIAHASISQASNAAFENTLDYFSAAVQEPGARKLERFTLLLVWAYRLNDRGYCGVSY